MIHKLFKRDSRGEAGRGMARRGEGWRGMEGYEGYVLGPPDRPGRLMARGVADELCSSTQVFFGEKNAQELARCFWTAPCKNMMKLGI